VEDRENGGKQEWLELLANRAKGTFWELLGCKAESAEAGRAVVTMEVKPEHLNAIGIVHGGVLSTMLDNAMGLAAFSSRPGQSIVTTNLNVHFVAPLGKGRLVATAAIIHESRSTITVEASVTDGDGKLGTVGTGSFRVVGTP
jgi:uncharacterized protein (TIGR00369 family)